MNKLQSLQQAYFDRLEENGIEFYDFEDIGNNQTEAVLKDEYDVTPREMCEYLGTPEWLTDWAVDLIEEETREAKNKREFYEDFNKKVSDRAKEVMFMKEMSGLAVNYD